MLKNYNGFEYTTCFAENQLVDALESGRNNVSGAYLIKYPSKVTSPDTLAYRSYRYPQTTLKVSLSLNSMGHTSWGQ